MHSVIRVLAVDDEKLIRVWLGTHLEEAGYEVLTAGSLGEARTLLAQHPVDALILDLRLPDGHGMDLLREALETDSDLVVIILSAHGDIETAIDAVKLGAYHFLEKPCTLDDLLITLDKGLETRVLRRTVSGLRRQAGWQIEGVEIIGRSGAMRTIVELIEKVAESEGTTVLVRGESGVGKEIVARA
ncbi:MAG: response regulator, partial [Gemmatimonadota bacterium]